MLYLITRSIKVLTKLFIVSESIPFDPKSNGAFTIADFGTADGGTSMPLMSQIIGKFSY